jgi:tetratricopeptide (TPR) repeat protein
MLIAVRLEMGINQISPPVQRLLLTAFGLAGFIVLSRTGVFLPRHLRLRRKGLDLLIAGKPIEAERCYRTALELERTFGQSDRVRLLVCLSDALFDQGRYPEAKQHLSTALGIGDPTGSGQGSMCDLLLAMKTEPEKAIQMADEAVRLTSNAPHNQAFGTGWELAKSNLYDAKSWARKTRALLLLDRQTEARQAIDRALRILEASKELVARSMPETSPPEAIILGGRLRNMKELAIANAHWEVGMALLEMRDKDKAIEHLKIVQSTDRRGKYRHLAEQKLRDLG